MATKIIGVRELKLRAPALVRRASRGERILITRYGKPQAELGPAESEANVGPVRESRRLTEWQAERRTFEALQPKLERRFRGRYVALHRGRVIGSDIDADALFERIWRKLRGATFFIGRIGGPPPIMDMPGFDIE